MLEILTRKKKRPMTCVIQRHVAVYIDPDPDYKDRTYPDYEKTTHRPSVTGHPHRNRNRNRIGNAFFRFVHGQVRRRRRVMVGCMHDIDTTSLDSLHGAHLSLAGLDPARPDCDCDCDVRASTSLASVGTPQRRHPNGGNRGLAALRCAAYSPRIRRVWAHATLECVVRGGRLVTGDWLVGERASLIITPITRRNLYNLLISVTVQNGNMSCDFTCKRAP